MDKLEDVSVKYLSIRERIPKGFRRGRHKKNKLHSKEVRV